jgi:hypothetical protein
MYEVYSTESSEVTDIVVVILTSESVDVTGFQVLVLKSKRGERKLHYLQKW